MVKNIKSLGLLRNGKVYATKQLAQQALTQANPTNDGVAKLARYLDQVLGGAPIIRTLIGFYANADEMEDAGGGQSSYSILDVDGNASDVTALREAIAAINAKIGEGIDGTTLTIAINDINAKIGDGFDAENTVAKALDDLESAMTITVEKAQESGDYAAVYVIKQGDTTIQTINIPKDQFVKWAGVVNGTWNGNEFTPDPQGQDQAIEIQFQVEGQAPIYINVKDLVSMYVGDKGIEIDGDKVSVKIASDSETFLTVDANGLKLSGVQAAIDDAIEAAKLHESDGIKILGNNKIKAHAASYIGEGIVNPIFVDEEGIKLAKEIDMGFYDYQVAVNELPSAAEAANTNLVITNSNVAASMTDGTQYNTVTIANVDMNGGDLKFNAKKELSIDNVELSGNKGESNGRVLFTADTVNISNVEILDGSAIYNVFEGTQNVAAPVSKFNASNITVDNPSLKHNVLNVYVPADNAVINIKDSYFNLDATKSNIIRLANYTNATGVTINFENITWTYENGDKSDVSWAGLVIYQPSNNDVALAGDTTKIATWTINVKDCVYNGVKVNSNNFTKINQVAYLYNIGGSGGQTDAATIMTMNFS